MKLDEIKSLQKLNEDEGIHLDIEIYKPIDKENEPNKFGIYISSKNSSAAKREYITTIEEIGECVKDYVENYL